MDFHQRYEIMVRYLKLKVEEGDWHGVSDAANDLREMVARHERFAARITGVQHVGPKPK